MFVTKTVYHTMFFLKVHIQMSLVNVFCSVQGTHANAHAKYPPELPLGQMDENCCQLSKDERENPNATEHPYLSYTVPTVPCISMLPSENFLLSDISDQAIHSYILCIFPSMQHEVCTATPCNPPKQYKAHSTTQLCAHLPVATIEFRTHIHKCNEHPKIIQKRSKSWLQEWVSFVTTLSNPKI